MPRSERDTLHWQALAQSSVSLLRVRQPSSPAMESYEDTVSHPGRRYRHRRRWTNRRFGLARPAVIWLNGVITTSMSFSPRTALCFGVFALASTFGPWLVAAAATPIPANIEVAHESSGDRFVNDRGDTLYVSDPSDPTTPDSPRATTRARSCGYRLRHPMTPSSMGAFAPIVRRDGSHQWAYAGKPLYRYRLDQTSGDEKGDGIDGRWHVARPANGSAQLQTIGRTKTQVGSPYHPSQATTATKTDTPLLLTPQSIVVVPQQTLKDQQVVSIDQALKDVSGTSVGAGGAADNGQPFSSVFLRGFSTDAHFQDGVRIASVGGDSNTEALQFANVESVEVLKGPAAVLYGSVEPGGIVNVITTQPLSTPAFSIDQQFGSFDGARTAFDAGGPLTNDGKLLYNASLASDGSFVRYIYDRDAFVAPVLR